MRNVSVRDSIQAESNEHVGFHTNLDDCRVKDSSLCQDDQPNQCLCVGLHADTLGRKRGSEVRNSDKPPQGATVTYGSDTRPHAYMLKSSYAKQAGLNAFCASTEDIFLIGG